MQRLNPRLKTSFPLLAALIFSLGPLLAAAPPQQAPDRAAKPIATVKPEAAPPAAPAPPSARPAGPDGGANNIAAASRSGSALSSDQPAPTEMSPEQYYQLLLERQRLEISSDKQILVILDAHGNDPFRARADLEKHEQERAAKMDALFKKYNVSAEDYYRSIRGTREQAARAKYLNAHDDVRDQIAANSKELRVLEKEVWRRLLPAYAAAPRPSHKNGGIQRGP
jgi:hypothetical protein